MSCYCYLHIFPNNKIYVGTTQQSKPEIRWQNGSGYKSQPLVWNAICKYGWENIRHKVIVCETPEEMWEMEKELIKKYDTTNHEHGYNISIGGEYAATGFHHTEEAKKKIGESKKGIPRTLRCRQRISESHKGQIPWNKGKKIGKTWNKGKKTGPRSEECRQTISETLKNKPKSKWITPSGEIREMYVRHVKQHHPDWKEVKDD